MRRISRFAPALAFVCSAPLLLAQDVLTVGGATATSPGTVDVPIYLRDVAGTPLGRDRSAGLRIQGLSFVVAFSPASAVASSSVERAGILAALTPLYAQATSTASTAGFIASFRETTDLVPLTLGAAGFGDRVATLHLTLAAGLAAGTKITLTPSATSTSMLSNQAGTTTETPTAQLAVAPGLVAVGAYWGDANLDGTIDVFDSVILASYIVGNVQPGQAPFLNTKTAMNLNPAIGPDVDVFDLVLLAGRIVGNVPTLPVP